MSYFLLPNIINTISSEDLEIKKDLKHYTISKSLARYLNSMKTQIDNYTNEWDQYKKYTNPYEYIHTPIPYSKLSVCKLKPLSRSFFKLIEIFTLEPSSSDRTAVLEANPVILSNMHFLYAKLVYTFWTSS